MEVDGATTTVAHVESIECRTFPIERVTVFTDRAEVRRSGTVKLHAGNNEINIISLPGDIVDDSVRVSGTGEATIHEVQVAWKSATEREKDCPQAVELRGKVEAAEKELSVVQSKRKLIQKKREALDNLINKLGNTESARSLNFNGDSFSGIDNLFTFYDEKVLQLNESESELEKDERERNEKLNVLREDLNRYVHPGAVKTVTVVLESAGEADVELLLAYQVYNAYWRPAYDVRVENADEKKHMQITYSGRVTQDSGEEWSGCQLVLSTARPSVGGSLPELGTLDVSLYVKPEPAQPQYRGGYGGAMNMYAYDAEPEVQCLAMMERSMPPAMKIAEASVDEQALSTEFLIARPAAIPPDGAEHKVTIGVASLTPVLQHECVPSKNNSVYLTASATNTSALPFLQGEAAIFLDGNFITKSPLKAVSPGEVFTVSLGVDASVRVDYKPAHNKQGEAGLINKTATSVREQKVTVKNTRREPVLVTVKENVPRSTDEKIKVKLVAPAAQNGSHEEGAQRHEGALVNAANNLEWTVSVPAGDKKELVIKWQVDYPGSEKLEYNEKF